MSCRKLSFFLVVAALAIPISLAAQSCSSPPCVVAVLNSASFTAPVTPGSAASVFGSNLAAAGTNANASLQSTWPTSLGGVSASLGGFPVPLAFVSPAQMDIQVPWQLQGQSSAPLIVNTPTGPTAAFTVTIGLNPGIFDNNGVATIVHASNNVAVDSTHPASQGETVKMYCADLGPVNNQPNTGTAPGSVSTTTTMPTVSIGGQAATAQSALLTPPVDQGFIGFSMGSYEVIFTIPANTPTGNQIIITVSIGGATSNPLITSVQAGTVPTITSLSPNTAVAGGPPFTLTVNGTNFAATGAAVNWNGTALTGPSFQGSTKLTVTVPANLIANSGTAQVTVSNTGTSTITSAPATFTITAPTITASPTSLTFTAVEGSSPAGQQVTISSNGFSFDSIASTTSGGNWLSVSPGTGFLSSATVTLAVTVNSSNLTAGTYSGRVTVSAGANLTIPVTLTITAAPPSPQVTVSPTSLIVQATAGATTALVRSITVGDTSSTSLNYVASASTANGGSWLSPLPNSGSVSLHSSATVQVSLNPAGLAAGVYTGTILVTPGPVPVQVKFVISSSGPALLLGQTGLVFTAVAGGASPPAQFLVVSNAGAGTLNWTDAVVRGTGLSTGAGSGSSVAGAASVPILPVQVSTTGLAAGSYYGLLQVASPGAANSPQLVSTVLNVLPTGSVAPLQVAPRAIIFTATAGGAAPAPVALNVSTSNVSRQAATISGGNWLNASATPANGAFSITANQAGLTAGVYLGTVTILPFDGSESQDVSVALIVTPGPSTSAEGRDITPAAASCTPTQLVMAMRQLGNNFSSPVGWPINLEAQVIDDCGNPALSATTIATFSNGDPALVLNGLGNGIYSATWKPTTVSASTSTVTISATQAPLKSATLIFSGQVGANSAPPPIIGSGGVVNAASFAPGADLAPGSIVSVFGANLASSNGNQASSFPLPTTLANIKLTIGGIDAPIFYAGTGQVNAQIPVELTPGTTSQVAARGIPSAGAEIDGIPEPIVVGSAHPGIFIAAETSAPNQGAILNVANQVVDATNPAKSGDVIVIFCTGLGATNPPTVTGQAAASGIAVVTPAVTIGGQAAALQYAGVAPGFVGLYQINAVVPAGIGTGSAISLVVTQNGVASNAATIAVH